MPKYHDTGTICVATKRPCPLGLSDGDHIEAANIKEFEKKLAEKVGNDSVDLPKAARSARIGDLRSVLEGKSELGDEGLRKELADLVAEDSGGVSDGDANLGKIVDQVDVPDGGFTYSKYSGQRLVGFAVSPYPERSVKIGKEDWRNLDKEGRTALLLDYLNNNEDLLDNGKGNYFGGWHDPETGNIYFDVSVVSDDPFKAVKIAREKDQIAYFDFQTGSSVTVDSSATSGQKS